MTATPPQATSPDFRLTSRLYDLYQVAKKGREMRVSKWRKNYLLAMNRWGRSPDDPRDSEVYPILRQRVGWMTDQDLDFSITPAAEKNSPWYNICQHLGDQMEQLLNTQYKVNHWYRQIALALWDAPIYGAGLLKAGWDSGMDEGKGNVCINRVDPWNFYPDPNATSFDDAQYFFEIHRWSYDEIVRRFPGAPKERIEEAMLRGDRWEQENRPQKQDFPRLIRDGIPLNLGQGPVSVGPPGQGVSTKKVTDKGVWVYECWFRENVEEWRETTDPVHKGDEPVVYDQWRVVVFTSDIVLLDETAKDLWELDRHPYVRYVDDEIGEFWSTALVDHLAPLQLAINQLLSMAQNNAALTGNPIFMNYAGDGTERTPIINKPGQRLQLSKNAAQGNMRPDWLTPPALPGIIMELIQFEIDRMENIAGLSGVSKGQHPMGRQAQQTTQAVQESGFISIRSSLRNLETSLSELGQLLSHLIIQNYDVPRVVSIIGKSGEETAIRLAAQHFYVPTVEGAEPLKFSLLVNAGASNPTSRQARVAEMDALYGMGAIDRPPLLQAHRIQNWQAIEERMEAREAAAAQAAAAAKQRGKK
jgi:hypothetical protein